ncbi:type III secretion protein SctO [Mycetohabitans sp. B2]|uniref:type III secretion protein SctO n=1 Tax=Mycetohabitans sp. B2 TaxID=2841274 RepID=UPI001F345B84|nr:type III secretion protein SctO [Mycetohabitans sp. B2]MCF7697508.1 type III secretion protein SctO [Mycetohabitans sp. B2]
MPVADRRITALRRTVARRKRMEDELRETLARQRDEQATIARSCDDKRAQIEREQDVVRANEDRIAQMMTGSSCFSITEMQASMRYMDLVMDRIRVMQREFAGLEQQYRDKTDEISRTVQAIARNRGRIEVCDHRISMLRRKLDELANDMVDEEAEEAALARNRINTQSGTNRR